MSDANDTPNLADPAGPDRGEDPPGRSEGGAAALPQGFVRIEGPFGTAVVRDSVAPELERALAAESAEPAGRAGSRGPRGSRGVESLPGVASRFPVGGTAGRGEIVRATLPSGLRIVVRKYRRGGLAARLVPDVFAGERRAMNELRITDRAERAGLPVAAVIGAVFAARGAGSGAERSRAPTACWLVTREIEGAEALSEVLGTVDAAEATALRTGCARLLRRCHDAGLEHTDLNLGNFLRVGVPGTADEGSEKIFLVDLDRSRWHEGGLPDRSRFAGLSRVARSHEKIFGADGPWGPDESGLPGTKDSPGTSEQPAESPAELDVLDALLDAYAANDDSLLERLRARRARHDFEMKAHRLSWQIARLARLGRIFGGRPRG